VVVAITQNYIDFLLINRKERAKWKGELTLLEEESNSAVDQDTLLHGEALLVVAASDLENVALVLFAEDLTVHLLAHSLVVEGATTQRVKGMALTSSCRHQSQFSSGDRSQGTRY